jgi:ribosome-binding factor A
MSIRALKVADLLKREISLILQRELKDPRVGFITLTRVLMSADLKQAKVYFTMLPSSRDPQEVLAGLNSAKSFIRAELKHRVHLKYIPYLSFYFDDTLEYVQHIEDLIAKTKEGKR